MANLPEMFAAQVRGAFMQSGPEPIFNILVNKNIYRIKGIKKIKFDIVPTISFPAVSADYLMNMKFQRAVNRILKVRPCELRGHCELFFKLKTGQYVILPRILWSVHITRIKKMEMDQDGIIGIRSYKYVEQKPILM